MIDAAGLMAWQFQDVHQDYTPRDTILYALGLGCGADEADLQYVYEDGLVALPSMATTLGYPGFWLQDPATGVDWRNALHAGQSFELFRPLPPAACVIGRTRVTQLLDKGTGKGALLTTVRDIVDASSGERIAQLTHTAFLRGQGGFGGAAGPFPTPPSMPCRAPDALLALPTLRQAALIYRLSGDFNPLHADPAVAQAAGFPRPILHGLCTLGMATRAVLRDGGDNPARLQRLEARFAAPVLPGETIAIRLWHDRSRTLFRADVEGRVVLDHGVAEWR